MPINFPQDFKVAALVGKVEGVTQAIIAARSTNVQTIEPPLTIGFGNILQPFAATNESWEILSASADDTAAGIGARTVVIQYLDSTYTQQQVIVTLNGVTPVAIAANCFRHQSTQVITAGSSTFNVGQLTIRVAGGGASRGIVLATQSSSRQGSFTVPLNHSFYVQNTGFAVGRATGPGVLAVIAAYLYDAVNVRRTGLDFTVGEPGLPFEFASGIVIPARNTLEYQITAVSANAVDVSVLTSGLLINNAILKWPMT